MATKQDAYGMRWIGLVVIVLALGCDRGDPEGEPGSRGALPLTVQPAPAVAPLAVESAGARGIDDEPKPPATVRAELLQIGPDEYLVVPPAGHPLACADCRCPQDGCSCQPLRAGGCSCVTDEGGLSCGCTCGGVPSVPLEVNLGEVAPVPSTEAP